LKQSVTPQPLDASIAMTLLKKFNPKRARAIYQLIQSAELINQQGVVAIMPEVIVMH